MPSYLDSHGHICFQAIGAQSSLQMSAERNSGFSFGLGSNYRSHPINTTIHTLIISINQIYIVISSFLIWRFNYRAFHMILQLWKDAAVVAEEDLVEVVVVEAEVVAGEVQADVLAQAGEVRVVDLEPAGEALVVDQAQTRGALVAVCPVLEQTLVVHCLHIITRLPLEHPARLDFTQPEQDTQNTPLLWQQVTRFMV